MTRTLLIIVAVGAIVCMVCVGIVHALGGLTGWHGRGDRASDGPSVTRDLPWTGGESLHIEAPATISYTQGPQAKFTVTGPRRLLDQLRLENGELSSEGHHWRFGHDNQLTVTIVSPNTHEFHLAGAQELHIHQYDQDSLVLDVAGAADVSGEGRAKRLNAHISGAGDLDLGRLTVDNAVVSIAGAGDATVDPKQSVDITIAGAGEVNLKTRPPIVHNSISGFGSVNYP